MEELEAHLLGPRCGCAHTTLASRNFLARACSVWFFLLEGIIVGCYSASLSYLQDRLGLSDSELGFAVLFASVGTVTSTFLVAHSLRRFGVRLTALFSSVAFCATLPFLGLCGSFTTLALAMFLFGVVWGMEDVCANSSAVQTEIVAGKALIGSCHGSYSLAAAASSFIGGAILAKALSVVQTFVLFSTLCGCISVAASYGLYDLRQEQQIVLYNLMEESGDAEDSNPPDADRKSRNSGEYRVSREPLQRYALVLSDEERDSLAQPLLADPVGDLLTHACTSSSIVSAGDMPDVGNMGPGVTGDTDADTDTDKNSLFFLCCLGFAGEFGEAALATWSIIYYQRVLRAHALTQAVGYTCFMVAMAVGRFLCDYLRRRFGRRSIVLVSGVLALGGLALVLAVAELPHALALTSVGLTITGLGLSTLLPIVFSSAGHLTTDPGAGVATAAGAAYCAAIIASPCVGVISDACGLRLGMTLVAAVCGLITPIGFFIPQEK
ncbi:major facilitator superfamily domain-containing protein [Ochromonadaceae sp. CCMP2298]|nr:major facilitator superfamily domain-containing protein [Ochromonadaceae sp. CCMP2298]